MQHILAMYLFGCEVLVLRDKALRGPYASESTGRTFRGRLLGIDGESYIVEKENGQIVYPHHVTPLNEVEMVRSGLPTARDVSDAGTQTVRTGLVRGSADDEAATQPDILPIGGPDDTSVTQPAATQKAVHDGHKINILLLYGGD